MFDNCEIDLPYSKLVTCLYKTKNYYMNCTVKSYNFMSIMNLDY